jgi:cyclopropane fatty-acyl-phospholipid synthase-like methyltransferase
VDATKHYAEIYTSHVRLSTTPNDAIGGGDEAAIGMAQARILADAGVMPAKRVLEIGFGTGRVWGGLSQLFNLETVAYQGVDVVEELVPLAKARVMAAGLVENNVHLQAVRSVEEYPFGLDADALWAFSVFTHMESEDIMATLRFARRCASPKALGLFTFLPMETVFGKYLLEKEAELPLNSRFQRVRNVVMTRDMAESLCRQAGWTVVGSQWREMAEPHAPDGTPFTNQSWLLLTPTRP